MLQPLGHDSVRNLWTDAAIRDTVAAIAKHPAYRRSLTESLWGQIVRWIIEQISHLWRALGNTNVGRFAVVLSIIVIVALIVARIAIGVNSERAARGASQRRIRNAAGVNLLAEAQRLAATGDYTAAAHALFAAMLAAGASRGELRLHPSKTTGDYARELRRHKASWLPSYQSFRRRYDRVIYGDMQCSADDYEALLQVARPALTKGRAA